MLVDDQKIPQKVFDQYADTFRGRVRSVLESYDLTGKDAALAIRTNPSSFSRMIRGLQQATERDVVGLSLFLNCRPDWLLGMTDDRYEMDWETERRKQALWKGYMAATDEVKNRVLQLLKIESLGGVYE